MTDRIDGVPLKDRADALDLTDDAVSIVSGTDVPPGGQAGAPLHPTRLFCWAGLHRPLVWVNAPNVPPGLLGEGVRLARCPCGREWATAGDEWRGYRAPLTRGTIEALTRLGAEDSAVSPSRVMRFSGRRRHR